MLFKNPSKIKKAPIKEGVPPGQFVTKKLPVLTYGKNLKIDINQWQLKVFGLVEREIELDFEQFSQLDWTAVEAPLHCVTQWSRLENTWEGLLFTDLAKLVTPKPEAKFVMAHCYGDYSTNLPIEIPHGRLVAAGPQARRRASERRPRRPGAAGGPAEVRLEERQVAPRHRVHGRGQARLLGGSGLPQQRRLLERGAFLAGTHVSWR